MVLELVDWAIVVLFLGMLLYVGFKFKTKSSRSLTDFFLAGRKLPWYIAGISMVATTFAADTPLWVTEVVKKNGISGNWLWWNMLIGGMLTTFFFARLWRKSGVLTELEFIELRYSGKAAKLFRSFKSIYLGLFFNTIIIGWVNAAMIKILMIFLDIDYQSAFIGIIILMIFIAIYSSLSGLLGVAITDSIQFILAMGGCIILAVVMLNSEQVGGIEGLKEKLPAWRFDFFPKLSNNNSSAGTYVLTIGAFFSFIAVQWWSSWYPGNEPGGGGYVSQRIMSTKNGAHSVFATLFFQIAHYALRPWPWIIVALCSLVVYPDLSFEKSGEGFVMAMRDFMPIGLRGVLFTAFLGAYMSTISTQLNWGASYLTNDLCKRFLDDKGINIGDTKLVKIGKFSTILIMVVALIITPFITTIDEAARFLIASSAGLGAVLIARWYWWRINIWSEISATLAPIMGYLISSYIIAPLYNINGVDQNIFSSTLVSIIEYITNTNIVIPLYNINGTNQNFFTANEGVLLFTTLFTSVIWISITFLTKPTDVETLKIFYAKVEPGGLWKPIRKTLGIAKHKSQIINLTICWISAITFTYSLLFLIGRLIFQDFHDALINFIVALISFLILRFFISRKGVLSN